MEWFFRKAKGELMAWSFVMGKSFEMGKNEKVFIGMGFFVWKGEI